MNENSEPEDMMSDDLDAIVSMNNGDFSVLSELLRDEKYLPSNEVRLLLAEFLSKKGNSRGRLVFKKPKGKPPKPLSTWLREAIDAYEAVTSVLSDSVTLDAAFHKVASECRPSRSWESVRDAYYDFKDLKQATEGEDATTI
jgi:hypothetical protein